MDDGSAGYVINNHFLFYNTYMNYVDGVMGWVDSVNLCYMAALCPSIYGTMVYKSRALFDELKTWNDDNCSAAPDTGYCVCRGGARAYKGTTGNSNVQPAQQYRLLPNPNSGSFELHQMFEDDGVAEVRVVNELGQTIFESGTIFTASVANVDVGHPVPGVYLLLLTDKNGKSYRVKFLIQ